MPPPPPPPAAYRASILHFLRPPSDGIPRDFLSRLPPHEYFEDGCLLIADGKVVAAGKSEARSGERH
jgi:N-dimethylarginine dimethylaminohydrolase